MLGIAKHINYLNSYGRDLLGLGARTLGFSFGEDRRRLRAAGLADSDAALARWEDVQASRDLPESYQKLIQI